MGTNFFRWAAFIYVWGYSCGVGGLAGHELIHKKESIHKFFGTLQFSKFLYGHFLMEHISGHHKSLATIEDPATPYFGESLYVFTVRSAVYGYVNTWVRETKRVKNLLTSRGKTSYLNMIWG
jgi:alkane 1-monooxygenase